MEGWFPNVGWLSSQPMRPAGRAPAPTASSSEAVATMVPPEVPQPWPRLFQPAFNLLSTAVEAAAASLTLWGINCFVSGKSLVISYTLAVVGEQPPQCAGRQSCGFFQVRHAS